MLDNIRIISWLKKHGFMQNIVVYSLKTCMIYLNSFKGRYYPLWLHPNHINFDYSSSAHFWIINKMGKIGKP